ncbi:hypothetical protein HHX47_DHR3000311 [Lentinula edodes]|nr:hypothetical protein HHX47_DHR3000311 [Lentinula edodes]
MDSPNKQQTLLLPTSNQLNYLPIEDEDDSMEEIDPSVIMAGRRTRGKKVDYTSAEALAKAGLKSSEKEEDDDDDEMKEN